MRLNQLAAAAGLLALSISTHAQSVTGVSFLNGLALDGAALDLSTGSAAERRVGYFSDIYFDRQRNEWWGLSDRGPGGGTLPYDTRVQRFTLDVAANGAVSNFQIAQTVKFTRGGTAMNGLAPSPTNVLGNSFDPEGFVVNPKTGNFLVSDEYGASLNEFNRNGQFVRAFNNPANVVPRNAASGTPNFSNDTGNTAGKRGNRGYEGLAVSPDGKFAYAMLQSAMLDEGGLDTGNNKALYSRIVQFDVASGNPVAQYAYRLGSTSGQGRGISALVALGGGKFLVLERNNRGVGVGAEFASADKAVFEIDLAGATDVSNLALPAAGTFAGEVNKVAKVMDLDADTLAALGGKSPEKWEGLAVGPQLAGGNYLLLAGTDNDYSVTQNGSNVQFDVYFNFNDADPYKTSIQCPIGSTAGCFLSADAATAATLTGSFQLLPGVLHAYSANVAGYLAPVPEPQTWALMLCGLGGVVMLGRRRRV